LFSKDTGSYAATNGENFLDITASENGYLAAEVYNADTALFNG
jgi:hypothetical protein